MKEFPYEWDKNTPIVPEDQLRDLTECLAQALLCNLAERNIDLANVVLVIILSGGMELGVEIQAIIDRDYPGIVSRDFLVTRTYPGIISADGVVEKLPETQILFGPKDSLEDKDVVIIEDMVDSNSTLTAVRRHLESLNPKSVTIVSRIVRGKPNETQQQVEQRLGPIVYAILASFPEWVEGKGLDLHGKKRGQSYLSKVPAQT